MASGFLSCPYCNSRVPVPQLPEPGQRVLCPRCGEAFPYRPGVGDAEASGAAAPPTAPASEHPEALPGALDPGKRRSNRSVALVLLGVMGALALFALWYALETQGFRRANDRHKPPPERLSVPFVMRFALGVYIIAVVYTVVRAWTRRPGREGASPEAAAEQKAWRFSLPVIAATGVVLVLLVIMTSRDKKPAPEPSPEPSPAHLVGPAELEALGYLPAETRLVAAVHVAELVPPGTDKPDLARLGLAFTLPGLVDIEKWTGLEWDDLDHLVLGWGRDKESAQLSLVVQTRRAYDPEAVRTALRPSQAGRYEDRPLFTFAWEKQRPALLWCASAHTLVIVFRPEGTTPEALQDVPARPRTGAEKLPAAFRSLFQQRPLVGGTPVWIAGQRPPDSVHGWRALRPLRKELGFDVARLLLPGGKGGRDLLDRVQAFRAGLQFTNGKVTLTAELEGVDRRAAQELEKTLRQQRTEGAATAVARGRKDNWVTLQVKGDGPAILQALNR